MSAQRTKEEAEEELRRKTKQMPSRFAGSFFGDPDSIAIMNDWMARTHVSWGLSLAVFLVGISYLVIAISEAFLVPHWLTGIVLTSGGGCATYWQVQKWKRKAEAVKLRQASR